MRVILSIVERLSSFQRYNGRAENQSGLTQNDVSNITGVYPSEICLVY